MAHIYDNMPRHFAIVLLLLGITLIIASWTPIGRLTGNAGWTREDSVTYGQLILENHQLGNGNSASSDLTQEQLMARRKDIEKQLDALTERLEYTKSRPQAWSRALFWTGTGLAALGALLHLHRRESPASDSSQSNISSLSRSQHARKGRDN